MTTVAAPTSSRRIRRLLVRSTALAAAGIALALPTAAAADPAPSPTSSDDSEQLTLRGVTKTFEIKNESREPVTLTRFLGDSRPASGPGVGSVISVGGTAYFDLDAYLFVNEAVGIEFKAETGATFQATLTNTRMIGYEVRQYTYCISAGGKCSGSDWRVEGPSGLGEFGYGNEVVIY